jgi:hypothetical protein
MRNALSHCTPTAGPILCLIALLALAGCQEDEITHAIVPRASEPEKTRLLAVIYPHGDQTWFFKLTGAESGFKDIAEPFNDFMKSVQFADKADPPVTWTLPEGWKQEEAPRMVYAAFRVGSADKPLKLSVSTLPKKKENELLDNVNRWRGQLGLEPVGEAGLGALRADKQLQDFPSIAPGAVLVDMTGAARKTAKGPGWTYQKPDGWAEAAHPEAGKVRREAVFEIAEGEQKAEASVTAIGGPAGGLEPNVDRWRRQIDAPEMDPEKISKLPTIAVGGRESPYVDLTGTKGRTLGAIVMYGDKTWFFKLSGPADLVEKNKSKFDAFLKSVKFDGGMGGEQ